MYKTDIMNFFKRKVRSEIEIENFSEYVTLSSDITREIYINTITPQVAETVDKIIRFWNEYDTAENTEWTKRAPIKLFINSLGGDFSAMLTIMDAIKLSNTPVYTINIGTAYKEAFFVFLAGHQRYAYPKSSFVYERDLKHLDEVEEQDNYKNFYEKQLNEIKDIVLEKTKITESEYNKHLKGLWWIMAEDAHNLRICNEILSVGYKPIN